MVCSKKGHTITFRVDNEVVEKLGECSIAMR